MERQAVAKTAQAEKNPEPRSAVREPALESSGADRLLALQRSLGNRALGRFQQAKLKVGAANDRYEQEADRVADRVMRMSDHAMSIAASRSQLSRKCAACEEEEKLKTLRSKPARIVEAPSNQAPGIVHEALRSPGAPLDQTTRSLMEARFGYDFSRVRVHTGERAAQSVSAVSAHAYTVGDHIVFGAQSKPSPFGRDGWLLAHELAHTIQQEGSPDSSQSSTLQRFASPEHVKIGQLAAPSQMVVISSYGTIPLGEMIAMAGDYFESPAQLESVARSGTFGTEQIDLVRWKVNGSVGPKPPVGAGAEGAVESRYDALAARNQTHFTVGSSPGNSNVARYTDLHTEAIRAAFQAGAFVARISAFPQHIPEMLEGFAEHFLTDAFSAGHVRTPRGELQTYWSQKYPNFTTNLTEFISCNMATFIHDIDKPSIPVVGQLSVQTIKDGVHVGPVDRPGVRDTVRQLAGSRLGAFSIGDLISLAMHDADSRGLDVISASGVTTGATKPFKWRAVGDQRLFPATPDPAADTTKNMAVKAVELSLDEEKQAVKEGMGPPTTTLSQMTNPANYRALSLLPREDTSSKSNPVYAWKTNGIRSLPSAVKDIVRDEFKPGTAVRSGLDTVKPAPCTGDVHSGAAWDCFKEVLLADPIEALAKTAEGKTCPAGNPCPSLKPATTCP